MVSLSPEEDGVRFDLTHPWLLLTLLALPLLVWGQRRSLAAFTPAQRRVCLVMRAVILACLALALSGARLFHSANDIAVVFAVDDSASITPEARAAAQSYVSAAFKARRKNDEAALVGFGQRA